MELTIDMLDEHYFEGFFSQYNTLNAIREARVSMEEEINKIDAPIDERLDAIFMLECVFRVYEDRIGRMF
ncbi:hypothetical protein BEP19_15370 [Ammoniphilus oxalaticus]|uniref:Uncharacterized protein n=1 Tax=Ammoniphilus oxalaticus TaxID=66863 RepID=A0A419SD90_9BACL|nr:hypothetical protein [Ammoniphilus oxalaticus]RKD21056.1 hypothetical protein BEP19_15370 [Ammoniphilus oxalaticus]